MQSIKVSLVSQPFAVTRCSDSGGKRSRSRKTKEERKAMVEVFVKKYRASNNGNFPSLNLTNKEVGGSFYTVREIVREIIQENRVLGPATPISEIENVVKDPESPVSLSHLCGTEINLSQEDFTFLPGEEDRACEISLDRDHTIVEQTSEEAHANHADNHVVSEPEECNKVISVNQGIGRPDNGFPSLINNHKLVEEASIALPEAAVENSFRDLSSNIVVEARDPISDAKEIHCSDGKSEAAQGLTEAPAPKQANAFDVHIEDLPAFNGKATISSRGSDMITAAPYEPQLKNTLIDASDTPSDTFSSVLKERDQAGIEVNKNHCSEREEGSLFEEKSSVCLEKSSKVPEAKVANPLWQVIKSVIISFVKFWVE
ncbi:uncharacterized protein [Aristolochia californica]|uniref:uncharacterized protein n=1 Tax=Aristolochia californica TaxID=171875 RepID=UPI0035D94109